MASLAGVRVLSLAGAFVCAEGLRRLCAKRQGIKKASRRLPQLHARYTYRGHSIQLRNVEVTDSKSLFELIEANRERLFRWLHWVPHIKSTEDEERFIKTTIAGVNEGRGITAAILVDGAIAGLCGITVIEDLKEVGMRVDHVGYWIGKCWEGKGIVGSCVRQIQAYAANELRFLHRLAITVEISNVRSIRVAERCGFVSASKEFISPEWRNQPCKYNAYTFSLRL
mmetsp:Transcript_11281/g.27762  ORF Transcript_11281/g.27762 Transcript_11281/m.27762 type:complete len:226 (+) Transcript_11281:120-797(+)